jgi:hypothetical protein
MSHTHTWAESAPSNSDGGYITNYDYCAACGASRETLVCVATGQDDPVGKVVWQNILA